MDMNFIFPLIIVILILVYVCCGFRIVPQNNEGLVETLGKYSKTVKAGFIFVWPLFQRIRKVPLALQPQIGRAHV